MKRETDVSIVIDRPIDYKNIYLQIDKIFIWLK